MQYDCDGYHCLCYSSIAPGVYMCMSTCVRVCVRVCACVISRVPLSMSQLLLTVRHFSVWTEGRCSWSDGRSPGAFSSSKRLVPRVLLQHAHIAFRWAADEKYTDTDTDTDTYWYWYILPDFQFEGLEYGYSFWSLPLSTWWVEDRDAFI